MKYQLSIISTPKNTYTYVGSVPKDALKIREAIRGDFLSGKAFERDGMWLAYYVPSFDTLEQAVTHLTTNNIHDYKIYK